MRKLTYLVGEGMYCISSGFFLIVGIFINSGFFPTVWEDCLDIGLELTYRYVWLGFFFFWGGVMGFTKNLVYRGYVYSTCKVHNVPGLSW